MITVVDYGSTPSGFGLVIDGDDEDGWNFRFSSPCCGAFLANRGSVYVKSRKKVESISAFCEDCGADYSSFMFDCGSTLYISNPVPKPGAAAVSAGDWIRRALGYNYDFQITVE